MGRWGIALARLQGSHGIEDRGRCGTIGSVAADVAGADDAGLVHEEERGRGHAIAEKIEDAVGLDGAHLGIGEDGEGQAEFLGGGQGLGKIVLAHDEQFSAQRLEDGVLLLQLDELRAADASEIASIEEDDDVLAAVIGGEGDLRALGAG